MVRKSLAQRRSRMVSSRPGKCPAHGPKGMSIISLKPLRLRLDPCPYLRPSWCHGWWCWKRRSSVCFAHIDDGKRQRWDPWFKPSLITSSQQLGWGDDLWELMSRRLSLKCTSLTGLPVEAKGIVGLGLIGRRHPGSWQAKSAWVKISCIRGPKETPTGNTEDSITCTLDTRTFPIPTLACCILSSLQSQSLCPTDPPTYRPRAGGYCSTVVIFPDHRCRGPTRRACRSLCEGSNQYNLLLSLRPKQEKLPQSLHHQTKASVLKGFVAAKVGPLTINFSYPQSTFFFASFQTPQTGIQLLEVLSSSQVVPALNELSLCGR